MDSAVRVMMLVAGVLVSALPLAAGYHAVRRYKVNPKIITASLVFYGITWLVTLLIASVLTRLAGGIVSIPEMAVYSALFVGLLEEMGRFYTMRYAITEIRSYGKAFASGVGWACLPALIVGFSLITASIVTEVPNPAGNDTLKAQVDYPALARIFSTAASVFILQLLFSTTTNAAITLNRKDYLAYSVSAHGLASGLLFFLGRFAPVVSAAVFLIVGAAAVVILKRFAARAG